MLRGEGGFVITIGTSNGLLTRLHHRVLFSGRGLLHPFSVQARLFRERQKGRTRLSIVCLPTFYFRAFPHFFRHTVDKDGTCGRRITIHFFVNYNGQLGHFKGNDRLSIALFRFRRAITLSFHQFTRCVVFGTYKGRRTVFRTKGYS